MHITLMRQTLSMFDVDISTFDIYINLVNNPLSISRHAAVGETGYGCHTFYITDVFRNIVIIADIRHLLCLNIVSCAHINMQFVIFTS